MKEDIAEKEKKGLTGKEGISFPLSSIVIVAIWFGLLTGLAEALFVYAVRMFYTNGVIRLNEHVLWMAPLAEVLVFVLIGGVLALLTWSFPRLISFRFVIFVLAVVSAIALFFLLPQLNIYAKWLLAIGLSVQMARIVGKYQLSFYKLVRSTVVWIAIVSAFLAAGNFGYQLMSERNALGSLPPVASQESPNVILITLDTVRAKNMSLYGYDRQTTPMLDRIAKDSAVFDNAIATAPWTLPSHASMFTGRHDHELSVTWEKPFDNTQRTLAEELTQRGYETTGLVANYSYCTKAHGLNRGMIHYEDYKVSIGQILLSSSITRAISNLGVLRRLTGYHEALNRKNAEELNGDFFSWLSSRDKDRPFFAFLNYFDAHAPLVPPHPFEGRFGPSRPDEPLEYGTDDIDYYSHRNWPTKDKEKLRSAYDNSIAYVDHQIGELVNKLSKDGILEKTVLIITSDHGELLGEHNIIGHGTSLYIDSLHVPLIIRFPSRIPKGTRFDGPVSLRDLPETVIDYVTGKRKGIFPGESLGRYLGEKESGFHDKQSELVLSELRHTSWMDPWDPASKGDMQSIVMDKYHFIRNGNGDEELFDLETDPGELRNLAKDPEYKELISKIRTGLVAIRKD